MKYDYKAVEAKWQKVWEDEKTFHAEVDHSKPKFYALVEFPYPSAAGLHVGHPRSYTALDVVARRRRQCGYNVLYPMGWDAFGLPTENYAMKNHIHPAIVTKNNVDRFRAQLKSLGFSFDWDREINTTDPEYYKWTQWIFLQLYKHGLAYKKEMNVNWCTGCKCVLANEEVVNGVCERCGSEVVHRVKSQWMLKITEYADKLIDGLDGLDYIDRVVAQQKNWIGRSYGAEIDFGTTTGDTVTVYTTRCDTLFGATYMVLSPENALLGRWMEEGIIQNADAVKAYQAEAARKSDFERTEINKEKTGVRLEGVMGINPVNNQEIPIFISDYVLATYGTGAIMAVPAHDTRDWEFAKKFGLPIIEVVKGGDVEKEAFTDCETGIMVNSGILDGLTVEEAKKKITAYLEEKGIAYVEKTGNTNDEILSAVASLIGQVDAVFTPTDNVVMAAAAAVSEQLAAAGIPFYAGADSFVKAGAFATCGVNYTELGTYTAGMAVDILQGGEVPEYHVMEGGIITVNTETAAALGLDAAVFDGMAGTVAEVATQAE